MRRISMLAAFVLAAAPYAAHAQIVTRIAAAAEAERSSEIALVRSEYLTAINARDARKLSALYSDTAVLVPSDGVTLRGKAAIAGYFSETFAAPDLTRTVTIACARAESADGVGSETGRFEEVHTAPTGAVTRVSGVYVIIYTRDADGQWRVAIEVRSRGDQPALVGW